MFHFKTWQFRLMRRDKRALFGFDLLERAWRYLAYCEINKPDAEVLEHFQEMELLSAMQLRIINERKRDGWS